MKISATALAVGAILSLASVAAQAATETLDWNLSSDASFPFFYTGSGTLSVTIGAPGAGDLITSLTGTVLDTKTGVSSAVSLAPDNTKLFPTNSLNTDNLLFPSGGPTSVELDGNGIGFDVAGTSMLLFGVIGGTTGGIAQGTSYSEYVKTFDPTTGYSAGGGVFSAAPVPLPASGWMMALGLGLSFGWMRKSKLSA